MSFLFVDFEASSLERGSFPIEVAWVGEDGVGESHLIRSTPGWLASGWSVASETIHGISRAMLAEQGEDHKLVATRLSASIWRDGIIACSDAPAFDTFWMNHLLSAAGLPYGERLIDVRSVYGDACRPLSAMLPTESGYERKLAEGGLSDLAADIVARAEEEESRRPRVRHRALADAEGLWRVWQAISDEVASRVAAEDWMPGCSVQTDLFMPGALWKE